MKVVQQHSVSYDIAQVGINFATRNHYHRLVVKGKENLPTEGSYIIAPCHQNALMEPLVVLASIRKPVVFLARADIFNKPLLAKFFHWLRIMPVYRIRDGKESLSKNVDIFEKSKNVLLDHVPLCLMAEGRHNNKHQLLPLVKGMFRIAGETQKALGDEPLYIVPTGIDYDEYERPFANVVINYGKPIPVKPFMAQYEENEPIALNQMRQALDESLRPLMHDIRSLEYYEEINGLCNACNRTVRKEEGLRNTVWNRFDVRRRISVRLDKMVADGCEKAAPIVHLGKEYNRVCQELKFRPQLPSERWNLGLLCLSTIAFASIILAACWFPKVLCGLLFCLICFPLPFLPTHLIPRKLIKDPQFRSSVNYGIRLVFGMLYALAFSIIFACCHGWYWFFISMIAAMILSFISGDVVCWLRGMLDNWRYRFAQLLHRDKVAYLDTIIKEVSSSMKA